MSRLVDKRSLVLLCESTANIQMLSIALNVAAKKLEKLPVTQPVAAAPPAAEAKPAAYRQAMRIYKQDTGCN